MPERKRRRVGFELHRLVEYLVAGGLLTIFVNDRADHPVLGVAGGALLVLAAVTRGGRLAVRHWIPQRTHRALDVALAAGMVAGACVPGLGGLYVAQYLVPAALVQTWLVARARAREKPPVTPAPRSTPPPPTAEPTTAEPTTAASLGRFAGRLYGRARKATRS